ncbi:unnamed protein product [Bursaphelenchus okinawaensis]|uniref:alpha-L-fucosidase n=1 Tax=Bursaphelenchus okinawaensis TaxID=465554 RepID=A0A811LLG9_9BILA|nr:unnamed protein product [Bursaphelenchus okinawaensis]CAG9125759.1 unnamed protein product [Bursaphelenchus okinawaensis]
MRLLVGLFLTLLSFSANSKYDPNWDSLDSRPLPSWYDADKFGIFVHWGVFSVPAYHSEWLWSYWKQQDPDVVKFMEKNFPGQSYGDLASKFTAADFDAKSFADIVKASGAKYFVVTSKHHEGYTLWPSSTSFSWNSVDIGPHRDLIQEFRDAITEAGIHFGLYFSQMDWFHPLYLNDKTDKTNNYPGNVSLIQMTEIVNRYHPEVLWSDGDWEMKDTYWKSQEFIAWLFNERNKIRAVVRWGEIHSKGLRNNSKALGNGSKALGNGSKALGNDSKALGNDSKALGNDSKALGNDSKALGNGSKALGNDSKALGNDSKALGNDSKALGNDSKALGNGSKALGNDSKALGNDSKALGNDSKALGNGSKALGNDSKALGNDSKALGNGSKALGNDSKALGNDSKALGNGSKALGNGSKALGNDSKALGNGSKALGNDSKALGNGSKALGNGSKALGNGSKALGNDSKALGNDSKALGNDSKALGNGSKALGNDSKALGNDSKALGNGSKALGNDSKALGNGSKAFANNSKLEYVVNYLEYCVLWRKVRWPKPGSLSPLYAICVETERLEFENPVKDTIVVNDRWGSDIPGHHGSYITGTDRFMPGKLLKRKWESCMTLDKQSWGFRRNIKSSDVLTTKEVLTIMAKVLAWGGNLLLNIGPDHLGNISPIFEERLRDIGTFVEANKEAIFDTKPWIFQNESDTIWYTSKTDDLLTGNEYFNPQIEGITTVYAFLLEFEDSVALRLIKPTDNIKVTLLGTSTTLKTTVKGGVFTVILPSFKKFPHKDAIVLKIENAKSDKYRPNVYNHL